MKSESLKASFSFTEYMMEQRMHTVNSSDNYHGVNLPSKSSIRRVRVLLLISRLKSTFYLFVSLCSPALQCNNPLSKRDSNSLAQK